MSVLHPVIDHLDWASKRVFLAAGVRSYHPVSDLYAEIRYLRRTDETLRKYMLPCSAAGNVPKGGGKYTPRYIVLQNGWRVVPEDTSHTLAVTGEQLTAEGGAGAACLDLTSLSAQSKVAVEYAPAEAEVIVITTGGGDAPTAQEVASAVATSLSDAHGEGAWTSTTPPTSEAVAGAVWAHATAVQTTERINLIRKLSTNRLEEVAGNPGTVTLYDDDGTTPIATWHLTDADGGAVTETAGSPARRVPA